MTATQCVSMRGFSEAKKEIEKRKEKMKKKTGARKERFVP